QTLDRMLDRITEALLAERRLTDEVAHELRTPLSVVRTEAQLALLASGPSEPAREAMSVIVEATTRMDDSISTILAAARSTTGENQQCIVAVALTEARRRAPSRSGVTVSVAPDEAALRVAAPAEVVTATLAPIVDNAVRHARTSVELLVRADPPRVLVVVEDDGPGVSQDQAETVFTAGHTSRDGGAGLGLALSRRLARSIGATVRAEPGDRGRFVVDLPST
ncbi:MAG: sensor histidine kinase, partial [Nocardioidaceae bacterium]